MMNGTSDKGTASATNSLCTTTIEGVAPFRRDGEEFETWYKVVGDLAGTSTTRRPLIVLHGGPGFPHFYMLSLADLATNYGIPVVFYDQLGVGKSSYLPDKPSAFWTPALFIDELENLLKHLSIEEYDVLGHSWGGMLAAQYAATRTPSGLKKLVISNSTADQQTWKKCLDGLVHALPDNVQATIRTHEEAQSFTHPDYCGAMHIYYSKHLCRLPSMPSDLVRTFQSVGPKSNVLFSMYGPSQLQTSGSLEKWSIVSELGRIEAPTLLLNGRYDEASDECVRPYFQHIRRVKWYTFAESSHMPQWEERELYMRIVSDFLRD